MQSVLRKEGFFGLSKIPMEDIDDAIISKKKKIEKYEENDRVLFHLCLIIF